VIDYRAGSLAALPPPAGRNTSRRPEDALSAIVEQSPYLKKLPTVVAWIDILRGFFGAFVRGVLEDRVERQAPLVVRGLRARLESGNPPDELPDPFANGSPGVR
jgi:hypothetical protein